MAIQKWILLITLLVLLSLLEQAKSAKTRRVEKLKARVVELSERFAAIEKCNPCGGTKADESDWAEQLEVTKRGIKFNTLVKSVDELESRVATIEQCKPCGKNDERRAGKKGRFKKLVERVDQLEKRIAAIEQCKPCEREELVRSFLFPNKTTANYIEAGKVTKKIYYLTTCVWVKHADTNSSGTTEVYITYAHAFRRNMIRLGHRSATKWGPGYLDVELWGYDEKIISVNLNDGKWHHVCISWDFHKAAFKAYRDGVFIGSRTSANSALWSDGTVYYGQFRPSMRESFWDAYSFKGEMTGMNIWDYALTDAQIAQLATSCTNTDLKGNLFNTDSLKINGAVQEIKSACKA